MIKKFYMRFVMLWVSTFILPFFISVFYIIVLRYIFLKVGNANETFIIEIKDIIVKPELEIKDITVKPELEICYKPSSSYYSYFPYGDELSNNTPTMSPIYTYPINKENIERDPFFTISFEDISLPKTIVTNPPVIHTCLPPYPVEIVVAAEPVNDILLYHHFASDIQKDIFNSIYEPSYEGARNPHYSNIFELHLQIRDIIVSHIGQNNDNMLNQEEIIEIVKKEVKKYMTNYDIYKGLNVQTLRDTQHLINLLISEIVTNSIFCEDNEKFLLHIICRVLVFETLCYVEEPLDFNDPRIFHIISRFMHYSDDST